MWCVIKNGLTFWPPAPNSKITYGIGKCNCCNLRVTFRVNHHHHHHIDPWKYIMAWNQFSSNWTEMISCFFWACGTILISLGHLRTFTGAKGVFWGQNWPFSWPSGVPKWPKIGSTCRISFRLNPVICLVVFRTFLENQQLRLSFSSGKGLDFEHFWTKFWNGSKWQNYEFA